MLNVYVEESLDKKVQVKLFDFPLHYNRTTTLMKYWKFHSLFWLSSTYFGQNNELRLSVAIYDISTLIFAHPHIFYR